MAAFPAMRTVFVPWVPRSVLRTAVALLLGLGVGQSCTVVSIFTCSQDQNCIDEGGEGGVCEPNNLCTFPDIACPNGKRWHDRAGEELAGKCFDPSDLGGGTDTEAGTGSGSGSEGGSSSSGPGEGSTTLPADGSSSGEPPPMTDTAMDSSSGGMPGVCDDVFGAAPGYVLCEETPDTCSFNATLAMTSCDAMCMMFGSTCTEAFTNMASDCASIDVATTCDDATANDHICVCAKP